MEEKEGIGRVAAVGTFDGVHLGHRSVLKTLTDYASEQGLEPLAFTFNSHPLAVIDSQRVPPDLTPLWKKKKLLKEVGTRVVVLNFDESLRAIKASEWMRNMRDNYRVNAMVIGYDNTFGSDGVNLSLEDYRRIGKELGIKIITAPEIPGISSSAIRKAVKAGEIEKAREMLGRPYSITSKVVTGNRLGRTMGFPTANIEIPENVAVPKPGVYAAIVKTLDDGKKHLAMVNVGTRPTLMRGNDLVIEAHLIDWKGDLYDKEITVRFIKRIRDEKKFDSIQALKKQIELDEIEIKKLDI